MVVKGRYSRKTPVDLKAPRETLAGPVQVFRVCEPCEDCDHTGRVLVRTQDPYTLQEWEKIVRHEREEWRRRVKKARLRQQRRREKQRGRHR